MKKEIYHFTKEIVPVITGILIALFINNWNEEYKEKKYVQDILHSVNSELNDTKNDIATKIPLQEKLRDSLNFYKSAENYTLLDIIKKANGVHAPIIKINAWVALASNKIELIEYSKVSQLSTIEASKEIYMEKLKFLMNLLYTNAHKTSKEAKEQLAFLITDIISTEHFIVEDIEKYEQ